MITITCIYCEAILMDPEAVASSKRLSQLIEASVAESPFIKRAELQLELTRFGAVNKGVVVHAVLHGRVNGAAFRETLEWFELIEDPDALTHLLEGITRLPFYIPWILFQYFYKSQCPEKRRTEVLTKAEFEIANTFESALRSFVGAPPTASRQSWRNSYVVATACYMLAFFVFVVLLLQVDTRSDRFGRSDTAFPVRLFIMAICASITSLPAGIGGMFAALLFIPRDHIENELSGQSLKRFVGVKTVVGLRTVSVLGALFCFGLTAVLVWVFSWLK